jgi:hypothetical protein
MTAGLRTPRRGECIDQLLLPLFPDPVPTMTSCACQPQTVRACGHCTHCDTCLDCMQCAGPGCPHGECDE